MIVVQDDFLKQGEYDKLKDYIKKTEWQIFDTGDKKFSYMETPIELYENFMVQGHELFFSFIRRAYKGFDNEPRIHADYVINGTMTNLASVLYLSDEDVTTNGTNFYDHINYGKKLPQGISNEEHDYLLKDQCNDLTKWKLTDTITSRPNRNLIYDANYFHGKFPHEVTEGERIVLVNFYTNIK